tara:strand:+ start:1904 stop:2323 length:420 start_codon:yes stop_codon:yes gene_type:complete
MKYLFILLCFLVASCATPKPYKSNTTMVVEYEGKEIYRRGPGYTGERELRELADQEREYIVIFSADYCRACKLTKKALSQANLRVEVHYVNMEEEWVKQLASIMGIRSIPYMLHVGKSKRTIASRHGAGRVVTYLISRF